MNLQLKEVRDFRNARSSDIPEYQSFIITLNGEILAPGLVQAWSPKSVCLPVHRWRTVLQVSERLCDSKLPLHSCLHLTCMHAFAERPNTLSFIS